MATIKNTKRRRALGFRDVNVFTPQIVPLKVADGGTGHEKIRRDYGDVPRKHSLDFSDDGQTHKVARYVGMPDKRVGIEHWLEDGIVDGSPSRPPTEDMRALGQLHVEGDPRLTYESQETVLGDFVSGERLGSPACIHYVDLESSRAFDNPDTSAPNTFSSSAAATALRLRLRVALFKVQTNQTAIPISHLQLPETSPQPLSVFPPSLVRVSAANNAYDGHCDFYDDEITSAPPSSPPPLIAVTTHCVPFFTPMKSSSPSPNCRKPSDIDG